MNFLWTWAEKSQAKVALNELVRRPDASQLPEGKIRVENPERC